MTEIEEIKLMNFIVSRTKKFIMGDGKVGTYMIVDLPEFAQEINKYFKKKNE